MGKIAKIKIRSMQEKDLNQVWQIEKKCFKQAYSLAILRQELQIDAAQVWIATWRNKVLAYIDFWHVHDEIELVSIAVHPDWRREKIGLRLMEAMIDYAKDNHVKFIYLDVRSGNFSAQKFYEKLDFKQVGLRKRYYADNDEDAMILKKEVS